MKNTNPRWNKQAELLITCNRNVQKTRRSKKHLHHNEGNFRTSELTEISRPFRHAKIAHVMRRGFFHLRFRGSCERADLTQQPLPQADNNAQLFQVAFRQHRQRTAVHGVTAEPLDDVGLGVKSKVQWTQPVRHVIATPWRNRARRLNRKTKKVFRFPGRVLRWWSWNSSCSCCLNVDFSDQRFLSSNNYFLFDIA